MKPMDDTYGIDYQGKYYNAEVPDTLDLAERAVMAINGISGTIDPDMHYAMYFFVNYCCKEPYMKHHGADTSCDTKFGESYPMMRIMSGDKKFEEIETGHRKELISRIQGNYYWKKFYSEEPWRTSYNPLFDGNRKEEDVTIPYIGARMIRTLLAFRQAEASTKWDSYINRLITGLNEIAVRKDDYAYYPDGGFGEPCTYPRSGWTHTNEPASEVDGAEGAITVCQSHQIYALSKWFTETQNKDAFDLAARLSQFCMKSRFWGGVPDPEKQIMPHISDVLPDPACISGFEMGHWYSHFHARAVTLRGLLEYGIVSNDIRIIEFVKRAYEYTWTLGIPRIGWINCCPAKSGNALEPCALGDIIALGIRLSDIGVGDYWDDIDAVVRNHLVESQLINADLLQRVSDASKNSGREYPDSGITTDIPSQICKENVINRTLGIFPGAVHPTSVPHTWVMQCCTGNATQGLFYAWEGSVRENGSTSTVNLLLNRAAKCIDVDSYLPYEGKVVIHNKSSKNLRVRIPYWVVKKDLKITINGNSCEKEWICNYLVLNDLNPGDTVIVEFPIYETTARYTVNHRTKDEIQYKCTFRGSSLIDITPRDNDPHSYPLYQRDFMKKDKANMKVVKRFVADKQILKW